MPPRRRRRRRGQVGGFGIAALAPLVAPVLADITSKILSPVIQAVSARRTGGLIAGIPVRGIRKRKRRR